MTKSCYNCAFGEYHSATAGGTPAGDAPEPAWFRCQAVHGAFDAFEVDQDIASDTFHCDNWVAKVPCGLTNR